jgi:uncharacterized protein
MRSKAVQICRWSSGQVAVALIWCLLQPCPLDATAMAAPAEANVASHKLCLWRVTGGRGLIYLLGSIHVGKADLYPLPQEIELAFSSAGYLIEEADPSKADPAAAREFLANHGRYTDGDRLERHISDRTSTALALYLQLTGRAPTALSLAKPWMAYLIIHQEMLQRYGYFGKQGIDRHFFDEAGVLHKPVIGLETPNYHMDLIFWLFSTRSEGEQDQLLLSALLQAQNAARRLGAMFEAWRAGDTAAMEALSPDNGHDLYKEEAIDKRNLRMAQQLEVYLSNTPYTYFAVVGSGHLIGERGIIKLLQRKGYRVDQLVGH